MFFSGLGFWVFSVLEFRVFRVSGFEDFSGFCGFRVWSFYV